MTESVSSARKRPALMRLLAGPSLAVLLALLPCVGAVAANNVRADGLQRELDRLAASLEGAIGVHVLDLRSGRSASVNADVGFPMASTVKVPVAVHILRLVDEGKLSLQQQVVLTERDIYPEMGGPVDIHLTAGSAITVRDLLHMMLTVSDNNATDILIRLGGGIPAVDARMRALGIGGMRVDRYIWEMLANFYGDPNASASKPLSFAEYTRLAAMKLPEADYRRYKQMYNDDPRDTSTPVAMGALLQQIWEGKALKPETTTVLKSILLACRTGQARLKGMLPNGTAVAHKTGSVDDVANDVGVITLPAGKGDIVVAVFVKSGQYDAVKDKVIAQVARAAHDYFLFVDAR